ncbi:MAG: ABC transporter permease [Candidatus Sulfotelmatobacter sp.]
MKFLRRLAARFRNLLSRQNNDDRIREEIEQHLSRQTEENLRSGMTPIEARRQAILKFGPAEAIHERYHAEKSLPLIESIVSDIRYSLRLLRKNWGFTAIAATSLALAIGANTTIFSITKRLLLDRLDVPHAEQLRLLHWHGDKNTAVTNMWGVPDDVPEGIGATSFSYPAFEQLRRDNHVLEDLFAFKDVGRMNATIDGNAQILEGELVSGNYFDQIQVPPQLGRPILAADDIPGATVVALISAGLWQRVFGASPSVLGLTIKVNMVPVTIIGVTPPGFTGTKSVQSAPDLFLPLSSQPLVAPRGKNGSLLGASSPQIWWLNIMGRVKPGVSDATAQASLDVSLAAVVRSSLRPDENTTIPRLTLLDGGRGLFRSKQIFAKSVTLSAGTGSR